MGINIPPNVPPIDPYTSIQNSTPGDPDDRALRLVDQMLRTARQLQIAVPHPESFNIKFRNLLKMNDALNELPISKALAVYKSSINDWIKNLQENLKNPDHLSKYLNCLGHVFSDFCNSGLRGNNPRDQAKNLLNTMNYNAITLQDEAKKNNPDMGLINILVSQIVVMDGTLNSLSLGNDFPSPSVPEDTRFSLKGAVEAVPYDLQYFDPGSATISERIHVLIIQIDSNLEEL